MKWIVPVALGIVLTLAALVFLAVVLDFIHTFLIRL
jgi:hypothetical protein